MTASLFLMALSPEQRAKLIAAGRKRIADAEAKRREAKREQDARRERQLAKAKKRGR